MSKRGTKAGKPSNLHSYRNGSEKPAGPVDAGREAWMLVLRLFQSEKGKLLSTWTELQLTPAQGQLLLRLEPEKPIPMNELADSLFCDASNITGLVDKLESRDLIERRADSKDRRVKMIAVTKAGTGLRASMLARMSEPPRSIASLSDRDKKALRDILRKTAVGQLPPSLWKSNDITSKSSS